MKLKDVAKISIGLQDADFWIIRKGNSIDVGKPTKQYSKQHIGIKVTRTDRVLPMWLYYAMEYLKIQGYWRRYSYGTLNLKHIKVEDVKNIELSEY